MIVLDALAVLQELDAAGFVAAFWHMLLFDVPRYTVGALAVTAGALAARPVAPVAATAAAPRVTVLLAGHNEAYALRRCVMSLREQTLAPAEIVVVDDGSTDDMRRLALALRAEGAVDIVFSTARRGGKSAAINLGLTACIGALVVIVDVDTTLDRDALAHLVAPFGDPRVGAVAGNLGVRNSGVNVVTRYQAIQYLISISLGRRLSDALGILYIVSGAFGAFRRGALRDVGGMDVGPGEDADITMKLRGAGWSVRFAPEAWALTDVPESVSGLIHQRLRWDRSIVRIRMRKFNRLLDPRSARFSFANAIGLIDILLFQVALSFSLAIYLVWLLATFGAVAGSLILAVATLGYVVLGLASFVIAGALSRRPGWLLLLPYALTYGVFNGYFLTFVRLAACLDELLFRRSYRDDYIPRTVGERTEQF